MFSIQMALHDFSAKIILREWMDKAKADFYSADLHLHAREIRSQLAILLDAWRFLQDESVNDV